MSTKYVQTQIEQKFLIDMNRNVCSHVVFSLCFDMYNTVWLIYDQSVKGM